MQSRHSQKSNFHSMDPITNRTKELLDEMEARYMKTKARANVILIIGRVGTGKSSILEDLTGTSGRSQNTINSVTQEFQIEKMSLNNDEQFFMDLPGFAPGNECQLFLEIIRGIQAIQAFASINGALYVTCINQPRFDEFDKKVLGFVQAFCGDQFHPRITFVTTFWTAAGPGQELVFEQQLQTLSDIWKTTLNDREPYSYQHGMEYNVHGVRTKNYINWFENRNRIAQQGKAMISRHYYKNIEPCSGVVAPKLVQELNEGIQIWDTSAAKSLGLPPAPSFTAPDDDSRGRYRAEEPAQDHVPKSGTGPQAGPSNASSCRETNTPNGISPSWVNTFGAVLGWLANNVHVEFSSGTSGLGMRSSQGSTYRGPIDPLSHVDIMKSFGLDSSPEGRLSYAASRGIAGTPFTAAWGEEMRRDLSRRFR